jgi:hypothetical protein
MVTLSNFSHFFCLITLGRKSFFVLFRSCMSVVNMRGNVGNVLLTKNTKVVFTEVDFF